MPYFLMDSQKAGCWYTKIFTTWLLKLLLEQYPYHIRQIFHWSIYRNLLVGWTDATKEDVNYSPIVFLPKCFIQLKRSSCTRNYGRNHSLWITIISYGAGDYISPTTEQVARLQLLYRLHAHNILWINIWVNCSS